MDDEVKIEVLEVRPATMDDWSALSAFVRASNAEQCEKYGMPDFTRIHLDTLGHALKSEVGGVYIALLDGAPVGFTAMLSFPSMPAGYVEGMTSYVVPDQRRTKVAHKLGVMCLDWHHQRGGRYVYGQVYAGNQTSLERCLAEGAEIVGFVIRRKIEEEND
jgi:hypothetical protein